MGWGKQSFLGWLRIGRILWPDPGASSGIGRILWPNLGLYFFSVGQGLVDWEEGLAIQIPGVRPHHLSSQGAGPGYLHLESFTVHLAEPGPEQ